MIRKPFIEGEKIYLRGLEESDISGNYFHWFDDDEVCAHNSHHRFPNSVAKMKDFLDHQNTGVDVLILAVIVREGDVHIGNIAFRQIDYIHRSAEYAIIVGEKKYWGKGYAFEASCLLLKHGFDNLNLHRIFLGTPANNLGMVKLAESLGMTMEGVGREEFFKNGRYQDVKHYAVLRSEFKY